MYICIYHVFVCLLMYLCIYIYIYTYTHARRPTTRSWVSAASAATARPRRRAASRFARIYLECIVLDYVVLFCCIVISYDSIACYVIRGTPCGQGEGGSLRLRLEAGQELVRGEEGNSDNSSNSNMYTSNGNSYDIDDNSSNSNSNYINSDSNNDNVITTVNKTNTIPRT